MKGSIVCDHVTLPSFPLKANRKLGQNLNQLLSVKNLNIANRQLEKSQPRNRKKNLFF